MIAHVASPDELDALFSAASAEVRRCLGRAKRLCPDDKEEQNFRMGMVCRLLLSCLIDADRWDSACFDYAQDSLCELSPAPDWHALPQTFGRYRQTRLSGTDGINRIRADISDTCYEKASSAPGIMRSDDRRAARGLRG